MKISVEEPDGERLFRRPLYRWEGNIKMDLEAVLWTELI
jgi:hypothetical protein